MSGITRVMEHFVLVHSPLVGALTWRLVADHMRRHNLVVFTPTLSDSPDSNEPYWKQHADSVARSLAEIPKDVALTLVAHSGAGPLLPAISRSIRNPVRNYVFVDAGIPVSGATRLDLMRLEDPEWAHEFQTELERGERFPRWSAEALHEVVPNESLRRKLVSELHPRGIDFFSEPVPVFEGWPDSPCVYIQFSDSYKWDAAQARANGWPTYVLEAGHFHMLVEPEKVTQLIVDALGL